jgi:hypothetical protein
VETTLIDLHRTRRRLSAENQHGHGAKRHPDVVGVSVPQPSNLSLKVGRRHGIRGRSQVGRHWRFCGCKGGVRETAASQPNDAGAQAGKAQAGLFACAAVLDPQSTLAAANGSDDLNSQLAAADVEMIATKLEDGCSNSSRRLAPATNGSSMPTAT